MANPVVNNVDGSNAGPNVTTLPDTIQLPTGNIWKQGVFSITLSPTSVANATSAEQTFSATGIGLQTGDLVLVQKPTAQAGLGIVGTRVSAADTLAITFNNSTAATITPTASEVYIVGVWRVQPNWVAPATGNQLDW
jgi:hypothetical protein